MHFKFCPPDKAAIPTVSAVSTTVDQVFTPPTAPSSQTQLLENRQAGVESRVQTYELVPVTAPLFLGVDRSSLSHALKIGGFDLSGFMIEASYTEEKGKDKTLDVTLDNTEFGLTDMKVLTEGYVVDFSIFDGQTWALFGQFVIVEPERSYSSEGRITLKCLSKKITMALKDQSRKFVKQTDSQIVETLAKEFGMIPDVEKIKLVRAEVIQANEPVSLFINKLAKRNGFDFRIVPNTEAGKPDILWFHSQKASNTTPIKLTYRPDTGVGSVFSASVKVKGGSKGGKKAKPKIRATDFARGTVSEDTFLAILAAQQASVALVVNTPTLQAAKSYQAYDELQYALQRSDDIPETPDPDNILDANAPEFIFPDLLTEKSIAEARQAIFNLQRTNAYNFELTIDTYGTADLRVDRIVEVAGLGFQDDGRWVITKVTHKFSAGQYRVSLEAKTWSRPKPKKSPKGPTSILKFQPVTNEGYVTITVDGNSSASEPAPQATP